MNDNTEKVCNARFRAACLAAGADPNVFGAVVRVEVGEVGSYCVYYHNRRGVGVYKAHCRHCAKRQALGDSSHAWL